MRIMGIVGWKNAGKTSLIVNLVEHFTKSGYEVSAIKHAHHNFDIDHPGKDSFQYRQSGAHEVIVASDQRWALIHELGQDDEPPLTELLCKLEPVDLVLVEGFKQCKHPKIEVFREGQEGPLLAKSDESICAIATDCKALEAPCPHLPLNDVAIVARFIQEQLEMSPKVAHA